MKSFTERWNALGAELGAALVERWSTFAPSWAAAGVTHPRHPLHDLARPRTPSRGFHRGASVVTLTVVDKTRKTDSNPHVSRRRAA
ncbi:MAG: hypothetical protein IPK07_17815 [Deltaproteobacteria bacterium]|nr:hypothetical protein [Deltaproteobacteria bacterium]